MTYQPRRMPKRFRDTDCPREVLDIFDDGPGQFDRYTVFYATVYGHAGREYMFYRGMSDHPTAPNGFGISGEMDPYEARVYRERNRRRRVAWSELPDDVRRCVLADCEVLS